MLEANMKSDIELAYIFLSGLAFRLLENCLWNVLYQQVTKQQEKNQVLTAINRGDLQRSHCLHLFPYPLNPLPRFPLGLGTLIFWYKM